LRQERESERDIESGKRDRERETEILRVERRDRERLRVERRVNCKTTKQFQGGRFVFIEIETLNGCV
jgi:hypothetical protein